jgi:hypothetical protein
MDIQTKYGWQQLYATALLETDWSKIDAKIQVAEQGIKTRLHEFSMNHGGTPEENQAIGGCSERAERAAERCFCVAGIETGRLGGSQPSLFSSPAVTKCADCGAAICSDCCVECCGGKFIEHACRLAHSQKE